MSVIPPFLFVTSTPSVRTPSISVLITVHAKQVLLVMENGARVSKMNQLHPQNKILFCSDIFMGVRACSGKDAGNGVNEQLYWNAKYRRQTDPNGGRDEK